MELYADVIFLVNFAMDFIILLITSKLCRRKTTFSRLVLGSFAASLLYIIFLLIPDLQRVYNFFTSIAIIMIGVLIAFNPKGIKEFMKILLLTHVVAFSIGGAAVGIFYYTNIVAVFGNMLEFTVHNFSFAVLLGVSCSAYIFIQFVSHRVKAATLKKQAFYLVTIKLGEMDVSLNALVDTGNSLIDPISFAPVMIAEFAKVKDFLPDAFKVAFYEKKENDLQAICDSVRGTVLTDRIRLLPFKSLGNDEGLLIGFKPDGIEIEDTQGSIYVKDVIIGISNSCLSSDGSYQALLNPQILHNNL